MTFKKGHKVTNTGRTWWKKGRIPWNKGLCYEGKKTEGEYRNCLICKKKFWVQNNLLKIGKGKYCSKECLYKGRKGQPSKNRGKKYPYKPHPWKIGKAPKSAFIKGHIPWSKGKSLIGIKSDEKIYNWKGDKAGYRSIHDWVRKRLTKSKKCNLCGVYCNTHLANISQLYKRDIKDWFWLCPPCHKKYDNNHKTPKRFINHKKIYEL